MGSGLKLALAAGIAFAATGATAEIHQKVTGPIAVYWMSAATQSGFGMPAMGGAGGGRPDRAAMMRMMMGGGGGGGNKSLTLQLGSSETNANPQAEHLPPAGLGAGPSLPLLTPHIEASKPAPEEDHEEIPHEYQRPHGKMLIFWGCGEHAPPGQPVVIDFSQIDPMHGKMPPNFAAIMKGFNYQRMQPPSPYRDRTYGEWPNADARTQVPPDGSLVGEHTIQGNYSPTIKLNLTEDQDFLGPINLTTNAKQAGGWVSLGWDLVPNAQAYVATAIGGAQDTVVMWTSSEVQAAAFAMPDYLSNSEITRLVAEKALMGPATHACNVPKEVMDAMPRGLLQMVAYGGEANFVYPPRPKDPKIDWNRQWEVKVRYRSATGGLLGMTLPQMGGPGGYGGQNPYARQAPQQQGQQDQPPHAPSAADILKRGLMGGLPFPH